MAEGSADIGQLEHLLGVHWGVGAGAVEQVGQQHEVAAIGQPLRHGDQSWADGQSIHVEYCGGPWAFALGRQHVGWGMRRRWWRWRFFSCGIVQSLLAGSLVRWSVANRAMRVNVTGQHV